MVRRKKRGNKYLFLGISIGVLIAVALIINSEQIQLGPPLDGELEGLFGNKVYTDLIAALANCEVRATAEFIEVSTCEGLKGIDNNLRKNYRLMNDLNCNFEPIAFGPGDFKGIFDGQNHTVNYEYTSDSRGKVGLFSDVGECGIIKNLHVDANVKGTSRVGAIAGYVYKGILKEVYATGNVEATAEAAGGLVGGLESGGIIDSYSEVSVQGTEKVGGLVGAMWKSLNEEQTPIVKNTYANGKVIAGGAQAGGLIGLCDYPPMSSYWNFDVFGFDNGCGIGKFDEEMKRQATFVGWDFTDTWMINEDRDYPRLKWQITPRDTTYLQARISTDEFGPIVSLTNLNTWEDICNDKKIGESCFIRAGKIDVLDIQYNASRDFRSATFGTSSGYFDMIYEDSDYGNQMELPSPEKFPVKNYTFLVQDKLNMPVESWTWGFSDGQLRLLSERVYQNKSHTFLIFESWDDVLSLNVTLVDGAVRMPLMYGNGSVFLGTGEGRTERLAVSNNRTLVYIQRDESGTTYHDAFVFSY